MTVTSSIPRLVIIAVVTNKGNSFAKSLLAHIKGRDMLINMADVPIVL